MELKVWVEGVARVVCGLSMNTSCHDVVIALAKSLGEFPKFHFDRKTIYFSFIFLIYILNTLRQNLTEQLYSTTLAIIIIYKHIYIYTVHNRQMWTDCWVEAQLNV